MVERFGVHAEGAKVFRKESAKGVCGFAGLWGSGWQVNEFAYLQFYLFASFEI